MAQPVLHKFSRMLPTAWLPLPPGYPTASQGSCKLLKQNMKLSLDPGYRCIAPYETAGFFEGLFLYLKGIFEITCSAASISGGFCCPPPPKHPLLYAHLCLVEEAAFRHAVPNYSPFLTCI